MMTGKIFKIILIISLLSIFSFWANFSLAIGSPTGLTPCPGDGEPTSLAPLFNWDDVSGVHHYELYYKRADETNWTDRYPAISQYQITGLSPETRYQWYVVSCGDPECASRAVSSICSFATEELAPPNGNGGNGDYGTTTPLINPLRARNLGEALEALMNFLFYLAMIIAPILIIYAGLLLLTSRGDPKQISKAKTVILWTIIALIIVLFAKGLPSIIKGAFGG